MGKATDDALEKQKLELEALREQIKKERAELEAERAELEAVKSSSEEKGSGKKEEHVEMTKIKLYKDKNVKDDVLVSVNGKTFQIQRGVEVEVPLYVKKVLDNTEKMDNLAAKRVEESVKRFA